MSKKLASDLVHTSEEFTKMKSGVPDDETPRENPDHQSTGRRGLGKPDYESWTLEELQAAAGTLGRSNLKSSDDREALIEALTKAHPRR